jgi:membrane fusion protein (multidrug efflux system)
MSRRSVFLLLVAVLAAGAIWVFRSPRGTQSASAASPRPNVSGPAARGGGEALPAEAYTVATTMVRETVPALGTLLANESVTIVAESSRRIAAVHVQEGALVQKGDLLFKLDDADLRAELKRLEGRVGLAVATEERQRELLAQKLVSQQEYDRARSELTANQGELEAVKVALAKTEIRAPFAGRVGLRRASEGAYIGPNTPLTMLQDVSRLKLDFTLPERYADEVRRGQAFSFRVEGRGETFKGEVAAVEPVIDTATRSLLVRGVVPNPQGFLTPGASASVDFEVQAGDGILIPSRALVPSIKGHSVFVVRDGRAEERPVTIGLRTAERVQILAGLAPGDTVLTSNLLRLRAGVAVRIDGQTD